jgi:hypothetical protein
VPQEAACVSFRRWRCSRCGLMLAFLDHWLGDRPLSEEIKRTLLASL